MNERVTKPRRPLETGSGNYRTVMWPCSLRSANSGCRIVVNTVTSMSSQERHKEHHLTTPPLSLSISSVTIISFECQLPHLSSQSYASILIKNKWLVLIGTKGSFKTMIASHLLRHLSSKLFNSPEKYIFFNMDSEGVQVSRSRGEGRGEVLGRGGDDGVMTTVHTVCGRSSKVR